MAPLLLLLLLFVAPAHSGSVCNTLSSFGRRVQVSKHDGNGEAAALKVHSCLLLCFQFLCLKNIRTFLGACHCKFHLRKSDLFEAFDLFDVRDFGKVKRPSVAAEPSPARPGPSGTSSALRKQSTEADDAFI